jgi:SAM-dependent methyltransferase
MEPKPLPVDYPHRNCPICDGATRTVLFEQRFSGIDNATLLAGYDVAVCQTCGFGFADRIPEQPVFDAYYEKLSKYEFHHRGGAVPTSESSNYSKYADFVGDQGVAKDARIVDIGCATGGLLGELRTRGYQNLLGVDPSAGCADAAARLYGVRVIMGSIAQIPLPPASFDLVLLTGVLEHVRDLPPAVAQCKQLLAPGGIICVSVPDVTAYAAGRGAPFQHFSVEHINFFSPISLANLMARHGFECTAHSCCFMDHSALFNEPVVLASFSQAAAPVPRTHDDRTAVGIEQYVAVSRKAENQSRSIIEQLARDGQPILVWGTGTQTQRLLETGPLGQANIRAFVDSNVNFQGKTLRGIPIIAPSAVAAYPEPILVSSWMYRDEIVQQIKKQLKLPNRVIAV